MVMRALANADPLTYLHSRRTASYAAALAEWLGLAPPAVEAIRTAGLLHDVGKLAIPDEILLKPQALTVGEKQVMQSHVVYGAEIVASFGEPETARWIRHHHERFDGLGYPDGLAGEAIPLESRILHAADTLEALTGTRAYRRPLGLGEALATVETVAGTQLDPDLARQLILLFHQSRRDLFAPVVSQPV